MITVKSYVWPVIKEVCESIWGFVSQLLLGLLMASAVIATVHFLRWWSLIPFAILGATYYVIHEAKIRYIAEKERAEYDLHEEVIRLGRLPCYWSGEDEEKKMEWYKKGTGAFIESMEAYEKKYGKDNFYKEQESLWYQTDKYLRDSIQNGTF